MGGGWHIPGSVYDEVPWVQMTLIAAVRHDDVVWLAQDSRHVTVIASSPADSYAISVDKSYRGNGPLAWAWYGAPESKWHDFVRFVNTTEFASWDDLQEQCVAKRDELLLDQFGAVFVGTIAGVTKGVHVGNPEWLLCLSDAMFAGYCRMAAATAWTALAKSDLSTEDRFCRAMQATIDVSNNVLGSPFTMWRVDSEGAALVRPLSQQPQGI